MSEECIKLQNVPLEMIVAMDENGGIGKDGLLPWPKNARDFAHFKEVTKGHVVIMGSKTFEEIEEINNARKTPSKTLLDDRTCIVLSKRNIFSKSIITVEKSLEAAVQSYNVSENKKFFVIGGLHVYKEALPWIQTIHVTMFKSEYACDRYLPLKYLCRHFDIVEGTQDEELAFLKLQRISN